MRLAATLVLLTLSGLNTALADKVVLVAGGGTGGDGSQAIEAKLDEPFGVDFDRKGNMYIAEYAGHRVLKVDGKGLLTVVAGSGEKGNGGDGGPARKAQFNMMHNLVVHPSGDIYVADTLNHRVRKIDMQTGTITTFAGSGKKSYGGDGGPAAKADFNGIFCVALDPAGKNLYLADLDNRRIRAIHLKTGLVRTVAGNGKRGVPEDGALATEQPLVDPRAVAVDAKDNVYVLERSGHALRVVDANGQIKTVAGTGKAGFAGDGGLAHKALLNGPKYVYVDADGNVYVVDTENHVIRKYTPVDGKIARVAGSGKRGSAGVGGPAAQVELDRPHGVYVHPSGAIYIADSSNHRVLKIEK